MVEIGICVIPKGSAREIAEYFKLGDELGLEYGWIADQSFSPSIYPLLTLSAHLTKRIKLGTSVTNPYTCHPVIHANSGALVDDLSGSRFILGMGAGDRTTISSLGISYRKPLRMVRESVEVIRMLLKGGKVTYNGEVLRVSNAQLLFKPKRVFPIHIGARGPKMLQLAGEIGDGVLIDAGHPLEARIALAEIKKGFEKAGRKVGETEVIACTSFAVDEDSESAKKSVKWIVALITSSVLPEVLERHGIPMRQVRALREHLKRKGVDGVSNLVTGEMTDAFAVAGSPGECIRRIDEVGRAGVSQVALGIIDTGSRNVKRQIKLIGEKILPSF